MKEQLLSVLQEIRPDVDFEHETRLIDDGILDSFDIIQVVQDLNEALMWRSTSRTWSRKTSTPSTP